MGKSQEEEHIYATFLSVGKKRLTKGLCYVVLSKIYPKKTLKQ